MMQKYVTLGIFIKTSPCHWKKQVWISAQVKGAINGKDSLHAHSILVDDAFRGQNQFKYYIHFQYLSMLI